jgi:hypothetical protein
MVSPGVFRQYDVCEDNTGDCHVEVWETWEWKQWTKSTPKWEDVTPNEKKQRHLEKSYAPPDRYDPNKPADLHECIIVARKNPVGIYTDRIIFADMPETASWLMTVPGVREQEFNKVAIQQEVIIKDSVTGNAVKRYGISWTLGFDEKGHFVKERSPAAS